MSNKTDVTRREFIRAAAAVAGAAAGTRITHAETAERQEISHNAAKGIVTMSDYSHVRGFNYQPSYGSHGLETWGDAFDIAVIKKELLRGRQYFPKMNTIRLWLSYDAYIRQPGAMPKRFHSVIDLSEELGIRFIPTLFNGWHSCPDFGGISVEMLGYWGAADRFAGAFVPYIDAIVKPHANDARILLWDLCNEPFNSAGCDASKKVVLDWLERVRRQCKDSGVNAPIAVGATPSMDAIRMLEPISDVITFHPYYAWNAWVTTPQPFENFLDEAVAFGKSVGKPMLATETGWGALDDKKRSEVLAIELGALTKRGLGFVAHLLHHTLVADGHRPEYGPISGAGYMAFVEKDGSLRPHHDIFNTF
ncbi:MAG: cellulase family glycosylhydrolase [Candidatus Hydrogenedentes bacterium]|nr:cellulase family glycosylhydrolase [Candidatus Hydrogenedentota bacterium]